MSFPLKEQMAYSLKTSVHVGVAARLHHPQLLQPGPDPISDK